MQVPLFVGFLHSLGQERTCRIAYAPTAVCSIKPLFAA